MDKLKVGKFYVDKHMTLYQVVIFEDDFYLSEVETGVLILKADTLNYLYQKFHTEYYDYLTEASNISYSITDKVNRYYTVKLNGLTYTGGDGQKNFNFALNPFDGQPIYDFDKAESIALKVGGEVFEHIIKKPMECMLDSILKYVIDGDEEDD